MVSQVLLNTVILCPETIGGNCFPQGDCSTEANSLYSFFLALFVFELNKFETPCVPTYRHTQSFVTAARNNSGSLQFCFQI